MLCICILWDIRLMVNASIILPPGYMQNRKRYIAIKRLVNYIPRHSIDSYDYN